MAEAERQKSESPPVARTRPTRNWQRLGYRRIVQLLVYLVIIPTVLLLAIGIISMFVEGRINLVFGLLTISFVAVVITGVVLVMVFVNREANLSELQADFVSKVSHELRTPLTAIRLFAETMERSKGDQETIDQCLSLLVGESERLTRLIERLLDWGRMEAGRKIYDLRTERVEDIVKDVVTAYAPHSYADDALQFTYEMEPHLPQVKVDRAALVDALVNLLSNARKYGGSPPIVKLNVKRSAEGHVTFEVTDNGAGIELSEQRRIFQKFYRIDDRLSRTREGSGLGLAIVKHIARAHHAQVGVRSEKGKGSTFSLILDESVGTKSEETRPPSLPPATDDAAKREDQAEA